MIALEVIIFATFHRCRFQANAYFGNESDAKETRRVACKVKREAVNHSKMKRLCRLLNVRLYVAVGIMESLWHLTAREAPQGDIGKLSDKDIALGIDWEGLPEELVGALVKARWIDISDIHRLMVHDWHEHADDPSRRWALESKKARRWRRMKQAGGEISRAVRELIFARFEHRCVSCLTTQALTIDHKIPVSKGGTNAIENLQAMCRRCNSRKRDRVGGTYGS